MASKEDCFEVSADPEELTDDLRVSFGATPLWSQRLAWILEHLRRTSARTVLDLGCGEGSLLRLLREPANEIYTETEPKPTRSLHPTLLTGIDIHLPSLEDAIAITAPQVYSADAPRYVTGTPRWDELVIQIWEGGLEVVNDAFVDQHEVFVSTEVVEHLPNDILAKFFPVILGYYRPPLLLITTPNYDFNVLFAAPGAEYSGYPDPTGETDRVFRHDDHQREWTVPEFRKWCEDAAETYGYTVEVGAVGIPVDPDPWGRTVEKLGKASQTAAFTRIDNTRERIMPPPSKSASAHKQLAEHVHRPDPSAGHPLPLGEIKNMLKKSLAKWPARELMVQQFWVFDGIDIACGGLVQTLLDAATKTADGLDIDPEWEVREEGREVWNWIVHWKASEVPLGTRPENVWEVREEQEWERPISPLEERDLNSGTGWSIQPDVKSEEWGEASDTADWGTEDGWNEEPLPSHSGW